MRTTSATIALLAAAMLSAACGDGVDERYSSAGEFLTAAPTQVATETTIAPEEIDELEIEPYDTEVAGSRAEYSGMHTVVRLTDGSWLASGYDNQSDPNQPERGAIWRSDDLGTWQRVGAGISDGDNQQSVHSLMVLGDRVVAAGTDFARNGTGGALDLIDAVAWVSDDGGLTFDAALLTADATVSGAAVIDGVLTVWGLEIDEEGLGRGQIWRSVDRGDSWSAMSPTAVPAPGENRSRVGPIAQVVQWGDSLIAVGTTTTTDPGGAGYLIDEISLSSPTAAWEPIDIAVWYSEDDGDSWSVAAPTGLAGLELAQVVADVVAIGDDLVILGGTGRGTDFSVINPEDLVDEDFEFEPERFVVTIWTCDRALQFCDSLVLDDDPHDYVAGTLIDVGGLAVGNAATYDIDADVGADRVVVIDPATGEYSITPLSGTTEQVEALWHENGTLYLFGHGRRSNLFQIASAPLDV